MIPSILSLSPVVTSKPWSSWSSTPMAAAQMDAAAKAQAFAHRLVEFADAPACCKFFEERGVDFDRPNDAGWSVLMSACACGASDTTTRLALASPRSIDSQSSFTAVLMETTGRDDLVGFVLDRTTNVRCATATNRTTTLHLAAISANVRRRVPLFSVTRFDPFSGD